MSNRNFKYICLFLTVILVLIGLGSLSAADTGDNVTLSDTPSLQADTISTQDSITTVSEQPTVSDQPKSTKKISETKTVNKKKINSDTTQKQTVKTNTTKVIKQETATTVNNYDELVNTINTATDDKITINLNTGTYTSTQTITLETQTAKDITINGNTQTIDANKQQFLNIADGYTITLKDLTITNAKSEQGGAIENNGDLTLTKVTFKDNTATNNGGAIYSTGTLNIQESVFTGNNVTSTNGASSHGGAAITSRSRITVNNTLFANNTAAHNDKEPNGSGAYAGAIQLLGNTQNVTIANSTFDNNTARYGGAISVNAANKNVNVTIDNNKFTNNSALYGGAVVAYCQVNITNSNFTDNTVKGEGSGERKPAGGAVSVIGGKDVLIENNTFTGNNASDDGVGGAVSITDEGNITINNSTFIHNNATYGGAVYNDNYTTVNNSRFINNTATQGGAIQNSVGNITIGNSTFIHNNATFGGTFLSYGNQTIINNVFRDNVITGTGGVIYTRDGTSIEENNIYFNNTMPSGIGGVIYTIYAKNIQSGNKYINNSASQGGVIYIVHSNVTSSFDTFTGNNATKNGAVFYVNGNLTVKNDTFINNTAGTGGVIYTSRANITSINSTYINNTAKYDAGTIYLSRANINSENDTFTNNTARSGGVLYNSNFNGETVKILNATMNNNSATSNGGAICSFGTMSITNSTLYHNNATQGGAIYSNNILTLDNTTFTNNTAKNNGGAVYNNNRGTLTVNNSTFTGNNVTSTNGSASHGGAAITTKGETSINNTIFANNTAAHNDATASGSGSYAGAIQIVNSTKNITIANSTFDNNTARYGGAISVNNVDENVNVTIDNNKFMNNSALFGGAIVAYSPANITNSNFTNNTVKGKASGNGVPIGGAICVLYKNAKIEGSIFINNTANNRGYGGAIGTTDNAVLTLNNSTFTNNTADKTGGAVYLINGNQKITNNIFTNNTANLGGAVYSEKSSSTITNNNFTNNTARNAGGAIYSDMNTLTSSAYNNFTNNNATNDGGAIYVSRGNLTVINDTYINNTAKNGGAISGRSATGYVTNFTVENATFNNNTASANGGALYNQGNSTITNTTFSNNTANYYGGAIFNRDALSINNSTITGNNATKFGGAAVYVQNNLTVNNTNFINNTVTYNDEIKSNYGLGGAIYIKPARDTATADIENSTFTNNTAYYGGAIYNYKTKLTVTNTTLDNNTVKCNGGAIYSDETGTLIVNNSTFTGNNVTSTNVSAAHGGAAIITKGETSINNTIFANNTAAHNDKEPGGSGAYAGAIQILNNTKEVTIGNSTFDNNTARYGGAIVIDDETKSGSTPVLDNNTFINNSAVYGGAVVVYSPVTVNNSNFTDNTVKGEGSGGRTPAGGAIAVISGSITLENSTFKNNTALDNGAGGAVYVEYSDMAHINNDTFTANSAAASYGGAIYSALSDLSVNNTTFTDNNATHGGAIFAWSNATTANTTIANSTFTGNNATTQIGGAIYVQSGNFTVENSTFTQNKGSWGGAIFNTVSNLTVRGNTYNNNTANNGGAIYTQYGNITSVNNTYNNNTANSQGGAIYAYFSNQTTENDTYNNNTATINGGAVVNIMSNTTITNATVNNNTAWIGGAIFNYGNTTIADSTIENNTATNGAGAIYTRNGNMTITNTTLNNNNATVHGGAIYNYGNLTINNTNLTNNNALTGYGGAIYNNEYINANLTIGNSTVRGNTQVAYGPIYRYTTKLSVDSISDVKFNKVVTITGKLISDNTGIPDALITVTVNGETYNAVTNEEGIYTIKYVPAILGENKVTVSYAGNETYNNATSVTTTFNGLAHDTRIILNPTADAKYDTTVTITGTLLDTDESKVLADTIVTVKVNDNILTPTTDENGNFKVEVQAALKENTVTVNYAGNESYNKASEATSTFNGLKHDTTITIDPVSNIKYGQKVTVTGTLTDADTNTAITNTKVTINGEEVAVGADGKFSYEITATQGVNTVTVSYIGSDNYNTAVSSTQFNGLAHDTTVTVDKITDIKYGETVTVTGTLTDTDTDNTIGNAIVSIAVNGETYTAVTDSTGKYSLSNIPAVLGTNEVIISYNGNSTYNKATDATTTFNGLKHDTTITIDTVNDVKYGETVTVTGTLTDADTNTAIANTKVTINGEEVSVDNNGKFSYEITSALGVNEVTVTYPENDNYNTATETATFNGLKHDTIIIIDTISDVKYGQDTTVTGTLRDANGDIIDGTVTVNGKEYTTTNGVFTASVNAVLGTNTVTVTYASNTNYNGVRATGTFNGLKHDTAISIDPVSNTKYGQKVTVTVTGTLTDTDTNTAVSNEAVLVNGKTVTTDNDGRFTTTVDASLDDNTVTVVYNGNTNFNTANANTKFTGLKHDTKIIINPVNDVSYDSQVVITGTLIDTDSNTLIKDAIVTINDNQVTTDSEGKFTYTMTADIGTNNIVVEYSGNDSYNPAEDQSITFTGLKRDVNLTLSSISDTKINRRMTVVGNLKELNQSVVEDAILTIKVNNEDAYTTPTGGEFAPGIKLGDTSFKVNVNKILPGTNVIKITYPGDEKHNPANLTVTFNGLALDTKLTIDDITDTLYDNKIIVTGTLTAENNKAVPNAVVTITVNDKDYLVMTNTEGTYTLNDVPAVLGKNTVAVNYNGNNSYNKASETTTTFNALAHDTTITLDDIKDVLYGSEATITGTLTDNNGTPISGATIKVNGVDVTVPTDNEGKFSTTIIANVGENEVTVSYAGNNNNYKASEDVTAKFNGLKHDTTITLDTISDVKYGQDTTVTGTLRDANGDIIDGTVTVNGVEYTTTNGVFTASVNAVLGTNTVTVTYADTTNYNGATATGTFNGLKHDTAIIIDPVSDAKYGQKVTVTGTLTDTDTNTAIADAKVTVNGEEVSVDDNGKFTTTVDTNLGINEVTVTYADSTNYNGVTATSTFNGLKHDTTITVDKVTDAKYGETTSITGKVTDADTNNAISNAIVTVTVNDKVYTTATDAEGVYTISNVPVVLGENKVTVSYNGDNSYNKATDATTTFNGLAHDTVITLDDISDVKYGETVTVTGILKDANGLAISGATVLVNDNPVTTDSEGKFTYDTVANVGTNTIVVKYDGDSNYNTATETTTFTGLKHDTTITIDTVNDVKYGETVTVAGTLTDADTNTVIANTKVTINGEEVSVDDNGRFTTTVSTTLGANEITVTYPENDNYNTATETTTFNGLKHDTTITIDPISDVKYGLDTTVTGTLRDANGDIIDGTVTVNGKEYTTTNGVFTASVNAVLDINTVTVTYADSTNYNGATATSTFNGLKHDTTVTVDKVTDAKYGETTSITGKVTDADTNNAISNAIVTVTVNDKVYTTATNAEGVYTISNVPVVLGENKVTVSYNGDNSYNKATDATTTFNGLAHDTVITLDDISDVKYGETVTVTGILKDANGLAINGATVLVNDNPVTTDSEGKFTYTLTAELGLNTVNVNYVATGNYNSAQNSKSFNGLKHSTSIIIDPVSDVTYGTAVTVTGTLMDTDTNTVIANAIVKVNGQDVTTTGEGKFSYDVTADLNTNTVTVSYAGDSNYEEADNAVITFNGLAHDTIITLDNIEDVLYGDEATVTGTLSDVNGNLIDGATVTVNGNSYTTVNGVFTAKVTATLGVNTVTVSYDGDTSYNKASTVTAAFNGLKHDTVLSVEEVTDSLYDNTVTVTGKLSDVDGTLITGENIIVTVNGIEYPTTTGSNGTYTVTNIPVVLLQNIVSVSYNGNDALYNKAGNVTTTFNGLAHDTVISVDPIDSNIKSGDNISITGTLSDVNDTKVADAVITVTVNGNDYIVVTGQTGEFIVDNVPVILGSNSIVVTYNGNASYNKASSETSFIGLAHDVTIRVDPVSDTLFDNFVSVTGKLSNIDNTAIIGADIIVNVNGNDYTATTDNDGVYAVNNIPVVLGVNNVTVTYDGNTAYNKVVTTTTFNGLKHNTALTVNPVSDTLYDNTVDITGSVVDANGTVISGAEVTVTVNGNEYITATDAAGEYIIRNVDVIPGINSIDVVYAGNSKYVEAESVSLTFNGLKHATKVIINPVNDKLFDGKVTVNGVLADVNLTVIPDATLTVTVNGNNYTTTTSADGVYIIDVPVTIGENIISVIYDGSEVFTNSSSTITVNGLAHNTTLSVNPVSDVLFDETAAVTGKLTDANNTPISNADVTVTVNGVDYIVITDASGVYTVENVPVIPGVNTVTVTYNGNTSYNKADIITTAFNGLAHDTKLSVNPINNTLFDNTVTVTGLLHDANATLISGATVIITAGNNTYTTATGADGVYAINIPVTLGVNSIVVSYNGNSTFNMADNVETSFNGLAHDVIITVNPVSDILFDNTVTVTGSVTDVNNTPVSGQTVIVNINGKDYTAVTGNNGVYSVTDVPAVLLQNFVYVTNIADDMYNKADTVQTSFNGLAHDTIISVDPISDARIAENTSITGQLLDANNTSISGAAVIVTVNNIEYPAITGSDGRYIVNVPVTGKTNTVTAVYNGNISYNKAATSTAAAFTGLTRSANITVNTITDTLYDNTVTVTGLLHDENTLIADADITVNVNGIDYSTVTDKNGMYSISNIPVSLGTNNVLVTYNGDDTYNKAETSTAFTGLKHDTIITLNNVDNVLFDNETIITGTLTDINGSLINGAAVTVNGKTYTTDNGVFNARIVAVRGVNIINVNYNGSEAYNTAIASTTFTGLKHDTTVSVDRISDVLYDDTVTVTGTVNDANNTLIADAVVEVTVNGNTYITATDTDGRYTLINIPAIIGTNTVTVSYNGDDTYNKAVSVQGVFNGLPHDTVLTVNPVSDALYDDTVTVNGVLTDNNGTTISGADIIVTVNANRYTAVTDDNGVYTINVPATLGVNNVIVSYNGNNAYNKADDVEVTFNGLAHSTTLTVEPVSDALYDSTVSITGKLSDANSTIIENADVTVTVNGINYAAATDAAGTYNVVVPVSSGRNNVVVTYNGNDRYNKAGISTIYNGLAHNTTLSVNTVEDILYDSTVSITGKLSDVNNTGISGAGVTVTVNNNRYTALTNINGEYSISIPVSLGVNNIIVSYDGDNYYNRAGNTETSFNGLSHNTTLTVSTITDTLYDDTVSVTGVLSDANSTSIADGIINIEVNSNRYTATTDANGVYTVNIPVSLGVNNAVISYNGADRYNKASTTTFFNGIAHNTTLTLENINNTRVNKAVTITGKLSDINTTPITNTNVLVNVNGINYTATTDANGVYTLTNASIKAGTNTVTVTFNGNNAYNKAKNVNTTFDALKVNTNVNIDPINAMINDTITLTAHVVDTEGNSVTGGYVVFKVNNVTLKDNEGNPVQVDVTGGTAALNTTAVWANANITAVSYSGNDVYKASNMNNGTINIAKYNATIKLTVTSTNLKPGENLTVLTNITNTDGTPVTTGTVIYKLNGKTLKDENSQTIVYNVTNGSVTLNYHIPANYSAKTYTLTAVYTGILYNRAEQTANITLNKRDAAINLTITSTELKPGSQLVAVANIVDVNGNPVTSGHVTFKLNDKTLTGANDTRYVVNVVNGTAVLNYTIPSDYTAKQYKLSAVFGGSNFNTFEAAQNITLNKIDSYINVINTTITNNTLHVQATINNNDTGEAASQRTNRVSIKLDKHTVIKDVTVQNGLIDLNTTLTNIKTGNHTVEIVTSGNSIYNPTRVNTTVSS